MTYLRAVLTLFALLSASPAFAHLDPAAHGSFAAGLSHPIFGLDHVLAMLSVGLWAALIGGRAIWFLPTGFVLGMVSGYLLSLVGVALPAVEPIILFSVVVLGAFVALALRLPVFAGAAVCAAFGLFHGHAHGGEIGTAGQLAFAFGFLVATAVLHACGVLFGYGAKIGLGPTTQKGERAIRFLGVATTLGGLYLATAG
ncbi:HupE/UreJ family protein [Roseibium sp.]|uniref:HupE/UreJ family protein n=1 Tax=Roseibium sp. TaxID=1936156 RepID=UPI003A97308D